MQVILLKDVEKLGDKNTVVTVKPGYGRNYLIPQGLAVVANDSNNAKLNAIIEKEQADKAARIDEYKAVIAGLSNKTVKIPVKAGAEGKIFGSVNAIQISQAIEEQLGYSVDKKEISIPEEIKQVGEYEVDIKLYDGVEGKLKVDVQED